MPWRRVFLFCTPRSLAMLYSSGTCTAWGGSWLPRFYASSGSTTDARISNPVTLLIACSMLSVTSAAIRVGDNNAQLRTRPDANVVNVVLKEIR
jgi:hypothetical protein